MEYKNQTFVPGAANRKSATKTVDRGGTLHLVPDDDDASRDTLPPDHARDGGKYSYIKTLGRGGMKVVLEVHDHDTRRNVAMALLPDISTRSPAEQGQFLREARITASLEHPNIVPVHDIGMESSGSPYFTMKLLRGRTLAVILKKLAANDPEYIRNYPFDTLMRIFTRVCNAIAFAHSKGVLHLDLKPENVQIGDYGEVLVLDWGLSRKIAVPSGNKPPVRSRKFKHTELSEENATQVNGTPGYMAPEQISGSRNDCSPQTDIYSLGALLYAMITYQNPIQHGEIRQMLRDTLDGNIMRPSLRVPGRDIPYGIEAVVLKAMSLNPADRYDNVKELRDEVLHFMAGYATEAEKAGPVKKSVLFMRRHALSLFFSSVICLLLILLGIFSWREAHRIISLWVPTVSANFQKPGFAMDIYSFCDPDFRETVPAWQLVGSRGLSPVPGQWMVFRELFPENVRITLDLDLDPARPNALEIALIPASTAGEKLSLQSPMVSSHLVWGSQPLAEILEGRKFFAPRIQASAALDKNRRKNDFSVTLEHENGILTLRLDREVILKTPSFRLMGNGPVYVAVRTERPGTAFRGLAVSRLAPPENATSLLAGDTLLEERLYEPAIRRYLAVDDNRPGSKLAEQALQKAYLVAFKLESPAQRSEYTLEIKKRLAARYPNFNKARMLTADACTAWKNRDHALAIQLLDRTFQYDPASRAVLYVMELPHEPLPEDIQVGLLRLIRRTPKLVSLDLSNYGLTSLEEIKGLPLISLNCSGNRISSLKPLQDLPLQSLDCSGNRIASLKPLQDLPLRYLDCSDNRIRDFSPLKSLKKIQRLNCDGNPGKPVPPKK
ncbi:MAG: protein kinase [Lentisphaeria bacterium]|nr:protein kinase [Lentisphaeria bacterium]